MVTTDFDLWAEENAPHSKFTSAMYHVEIPNENKSIAGSKTRGKLFATVRVYKDGLCELDRFRWFDIMGPIRGGYRLTDPHDKAVWDATKEVFEWLREWEFVKLIPIGPEDSEYFATTKLTGDPKDDKRYQDYGY